MTKLLDKALAEITVLPPAEQDAIARWLLAELASERRWDAAFAASGPALDRLAEEAIAEHRAGKTRPLDPDEM